MFVSGAPKDLLSFCAGRDECSLFATQLPAGPSHSLLQTRLACYQLNCQDLLTFAPSKSIQQS